MVPYPHQKISMSTKVLKIYSYMCSSNSISKTNILTVCIFSYIHFHKKKHQKSWNLTKFDENFTIWGSYFPPPKFLMSTKMLKIDSYICSNFFMSKTKILDLFYFSYTLIYKKNPKILNFLVNFGQFTPYFSKSGNLKLPKNSKMTCLYVFQNIWWNEPN